MALPPTGKKSTATPLNPNSAQEDWTYLVDLSYMPQSWWDDANTDDATRGRASKADGTTELPCDWIDFDRTSQTGTLCIKYTGTKSASASEPVIVYPPNTRNTAYAATDTYGQYNAYTYDHYLPLGTSLQGRQAATSYTTVGTLTTGQAGLLGKSTNFAPNASAIDLEASFDYNSSWMAMFVINLNSDNGDRGFFGATNVNTRFWADLVADPNMRPTSWSPHLYGTTSLVAGAWSHVAFIYDAPTTTLSIYQDGILSAQNTSYTFDNPSGDFRIGYCFKDTDQKMQHFILDTNAPSVDAALYEYSQISDNSTFWGTWVVSDVGGGGTVTGTDTLTISDTASAEIGLSLTGSDTMAISDTASASIGLSITGSDSLAFSSSASAAILLTLTANDGLVFSDTGSTSITIAVSGLDSLGLGDSGSTGGDIAIGTGVDNIIFSDAASVEIAVNVTGSDTISLSEVESIIHALDLSGSDILGLSDTAQTSGVIAGILRLAIIKLGESRTAITKLGESKTVITKYKS